MDAVVTAADLKRPSAPSHDARRLYSTPKFEITGKNGTPDRGEVVDHSRGHGQIHSEIHGHGQHADRFCQAARESPTIGTGQSIVNYSGISGYSSSNSSSTSVGVLPSSSANSSSTSVGVLPSSSGAKIFGASSSSAVPSLGANGIGLQQQLGANYNTTGGGGAAGAAGVSAGGPPGSGRGGGSSSGNVVRNLLLRNSSNGGPYSNYSEGDKRIAGGGIDDTREYDGSTMAGLYAGAHAGATNANATALHDRGAPAQSPDRVLGGPHTRLDAKLDAKNFPFRITNEGAIKLSRQTLDLEGLLSRVNEKGGVGRNEHSYE